MVSCCCIILMCLLCVYILLFSICAWKWAQPLTSNTDGCSADLNCDADGPHSNVWIFDEWMMFETNRMKFRGGVTRRVEAASMQAPESKMTTRDILFITKATCWTPDVLNFPLFLFRIHACTCALCFTILDLYGSCTVLVFLIVPMLWSGCWFFLVISWVSPLTSLIFL